MNFTTYLHTEIEKLCPIDGLSMTNIDDPTTWRLSFKEEATVEQQNAAQAVIDNAATHKLNYDRQLVLAKLVVIRDQVINSDITVNTHLFFADADSISLMHQCITMEANIQVIFPKDWILADGSILSVTYNDIKAVAIAISNRKDAAYTRYMALMAEINTSMTPESIDLTTGWPL
jgi:hypothetical protein